MVKKVEDEARRLGITPAELERRIDEARAAITRGTASLDLPPGYDPGSHELRFPENGGMKADPDEGPLWIRTDKRGRPAIAGPLERAVHEEHQRRLAEIGDSLKAQSARRAAKAAAVIHKAKGDKTRETVADAAAKGKRPDLIAKEAKVSQRHVKRIQAASKKRT